MMPESTYGIAEPAPAQLASVLLEAALPKKQSMPAPASSGVDEIDSAVLLGGFRYGEITSIAGASGMGKTLIALHALASHLLRYKSGDVAFIDSTGSFSPIRLRDVILARLRKQIRPSALEESGYMYERLHHISIAKDDELLNEKATEMLDRVRVMRVFDFAGVVEAVAEVGEMCERKLKLDEDEKEGEKGDGGEKPKQEIVDSQDEDDEEGDVGYVETIGNAIETAECSRPATVEDRVHSLEGATAAIGMIILDTVTNIISSLTAKSQVQGHAIVTTLIRSLRHLCTRHSICALLVNSAVGLNPSRNPTYQRRTEDNASVFESTVGKPALGKTFSYLIDTSILLSKIPKTREDAEIAFDDGNSRQWKSVGVFEVLKDKYGTREGQWALFHMADGVSLRSAY